MTKTSPFVLSGARLAALSMASAGDPAILDLVRNYEVALTGLIELREILAAELEFFNV